MNQLEGPVPARLGEEVLAQIEEMVQIVIRQIVGGGIIGPENDQGLPMILSRGTKPQ